MNRPTVPVEGASLSLLLDTVQQLHLRVISTKEQPSLEEELDVETLLQRAWAAEKLLEALCARQS